MGRVLGIVYRCIATHLIKKAGFSRKTAQTGAVTLIQRFGSALNLNVHFHMLFLDGVYIERHDGSLRFRWVQAPTSVDIARLTQALALRISRYLERQGLLERDAENSYLVGDALESGAMEQLMGSSITYRIAVGPQQGRKVFTLQTLPACEEPFDEGVGRWRDESGHPALSPSGPPAAAHNRSGRFCPAWRRERTDARSSSGCVATSVGRPSRKSVCRSRRTAMSVTM
jgi:hypothetical protein